MDLKQFDIWFVTGSQHLYGEATLKQVDEDSRKIAEGLSKSKVIPVNVVFKPVVTTPNAIFQVCQEANADNKCVGLITWVHTFSPAKMWIAGLGVLQKPFVHLHTQVIRVGLQPTEELERQGTIVAGPYHPAFRQLVDSSAYLDRMRRLLRDHPRERDSVILLVHPYDLSAAKGLRKANISRIREEFGLQASEHSARRRCPPAFDSPLPMIAPPPHACGILSPGGIR